MNYAILSINTTGSELKNHKILELAILLSDGSEIIDTYEVLLHPEMNVPYSCTRKTGIENSAVATCYKFYEIASKIIAITKDATIVGHHIQHSYAFLQKEFQLLGYDFSAPTICTAKLARQLLPNLPAYGMEDLLRFFQKENPVGIKAYSKALSVVLVFHRLFPNMRNSKVAEKLSSKKPSLLGFEKCPNKPGIYYFFNAKNEIIYVGKSKQLKTRVMSHLRNLKTYKGIAIIEHVHRMEFKITANESMALLYEDMEIKKHQPRYNVASKRIRFPFGLYLNKEQEYHQLVIERKAASDNGSIVEFSSKRGAMAYLRRVTEQYQLCNIINKIESYVGGACFKHRLKECYGACVGEENPESYNQRIIQFIEDRSFTKQHYVMTAQGRKLNEYCFILVKDGRVVGFGFLPKRSFRASEKILLAKSEQVKYNNDLHKILKIALADNSFKIHELNIQSNQPFTV